MAQRAITNHGGHTRGAIKRGIERKRRNRDALKCLGELLNAGRWDLDEGGWRFWIVDDDAWKKAQGGVPGAQVEPDHQEVLCDDGGSSEGADTALT